MIARLRCIVYQSSLLLSAVLSALRRNSMTDPGNTCDSSNGRGNGPNISEVVHRRFDFQGMKISMVAMETALLPFDFVLISFLGNHQTGTRTVLVKYLRTAPFSQVAHYRIDVLSPLAYLPY